MYLSHGLLFTGRCDSETDVHPYVFSPYVIIKHVAHPRNGQCDPSNLSRVPASPDPKISLDLNSETVARIRALAWIALIGFATYVALSKQADMLWMPRYSKPTVWH